MRRFFRAIRSVWDGLNVEDKLDLVQVGIIALLCTVAIAMIGHALQPYHDPDPKPLGKTIYLQPY